MQKGLFVALEGNDGAGKTTAAQALLKRLKKDGFDVVLSREPGGPVISEQIRSILLDPANKAMNPKTEALL
ncbi:dTMP kinase, partial [Ileibacterium valens]